MNFIPFNDLSRIHLPMVREFQHDIRELCKSSEWVLGSAVTEFEVCLAKMESSRFAVTVNTGTAALELLLRANKIGPGDEVLIPAMTFVATAYSVIQTGALPVLVDVNPKTGLIDPTTLKKYITPKTKALVFVTLHGRVDYLEDSRSICDEFSIKLFIDGAQSHLGTFAGVSQCKYAHGVALSFYPGKNLGALGEGGAILTDDESIFEQLKLSRNWGAKERYRHDEFGGNFRLDSLQCSFLLRKLKKLESWTNERKSIGRAYRKKLNSEVLMDSQTSKGDHVYHIFSIKVQDRHRVIMDLNKVGVSTSIHYPLALHQNKYYSGRVKLMDKLSGAETFAEQNLSLPIFPKMTDEEISYVVSSVNKLVK